ncbi:SWIM zinc finger family protein [Candidatus Venteria ishoeyi]|uniref:SWIM zinc finger family protein n=1 Tax=Candidatus Venteria ishoeyi TaxID=1899563 RepID=UPI0025A665EF|nr:SWIM zinc finger family protein [Candidatus Venteria ishoeyi]MDM8548232.1 SWIM zinc finger family protein [Candidatus Venteria ishoeyi]
MAKLSKTWWGQKFIEALEDFTNSGRLSRGRSYSSDRRILKFEIKKGGIVTATVRGNKNAYFGVYKEPKYTIKLQMMQVPEQDWKKVINYLGSKASLVSRLLMNEMPDNIDAAFSDVKLHLLPRSREDFKLTQCSCPDYANPCKHIAGVYYRLATQLDQDPFLLFELRGLPRDKLHDALCQSPLGEVLASTIDERGDAIEEVVDSYYPRPLPAGGIADYHSFWHGHKRLPTDIEAPAPAAVPAILVKKAGDNPAFWHQDNSFIEIMEDVYARVRKNRAKTGI